jgi:signal transduction histidine kinase
MPPLESELAVLEIPRIAALATSPWPAWLWNADATRILWTNAVGAAIFGAANASECTKARFTANDPSAAQILRLVAALPSAPRERLARLRGFGAGLGGALMCACSRIVLFDGTPAILVAATERAGPSLSLAERVQRLFSGSADAVAAFAPDGTLLHANAAAAQRLNGTSSLSALGIDALITQALRDGSASGTSHIGQIPVEVRALRLGQDDWRVLLLAWATQLKAAAATTKLDGQPTSATSTPEVDAPILPWPPDVAGAPAESDPPPSHQPDESQADESIGTTAPITAEKTSSHRATARDAPISPEETATEPPPIRQTPPHDEPVAAAPSTATEPTPSHETTPDDEPPIATKQSRSIDARFHQSATHDVSIADRRHPLRFVWQTDPDNRFVVGSDEFMELVGPRTTAACGRLWSEIAAEMNLDPEGQVARAIATQETWSGILIFWPVDDSSERLPVELSGLPVFDRDHAFGGYRGFGVCRDVARINQLARARRARPIGFMPTAEAAAPENRDSAPPAPNVAAALALVAEPQAEAVTAEKVEPAVRPAPQTTPPSLGVVTTAPNVVPFRTGQTPEPKAPSLSPIERSAFRELAQELTDRLRGTAQGPAVVEGIFEGPQDQEAAPTAVEPSGPAAAGSETTTSNEASARVAADIPPNAPSIAVARNDTSSPAAQQLPPGEHVLLDRVPAGVLVYHRNSPLYANRRFLEWSGYDTVEGLTAAGGLSALFVDPGADTLRDGGGTQKLSITTRRGDKLPLEGRLFTVPWNGAPTLALIVTNTQGEDHQRSTQRALNAAESEMRGLEIEIRDLKSSLERAGRREAQKAAAAKADFLAKVSHEIRTPLNSMVGFAEVIMAERFGSIGNERYREYLKDMHAAGMQMVSLLNDLLDLSKIETGQLDLTFANVDLNDLTQQCVAVTQPQANRARIIIRSALAPGPLHVMADARSLRQIVLTLLSNAIKFTGPGGQVIVSTAAADNGDAVLRVRDTGVGMREQDIEAVLDPFHLTTASPSWGSSGAGLGLPLTKALAEANRASFSIKSAPNTGTLVEITFPGSHMVAH